MKKTKSIIILTILSMISCQYAVAGRDKRSHKVRDKAEAWCKEYTRLHNGEECRIVRKVKLCPKGFRQEKTFKKLRANDYKACIRGSKMHVVKRAAKKAVNAVQGAPILPVGGLVQLYKMYFKRVKNNSGHKQKLPDWVVDKYQRYFKNNLKKVTVAESSKVYPGNAMTDCNKIYFPKGVLAGLLDKDKAADGKASVWLLHEMWHTEQCYKKGGRNSYAAMWFRKESVGLVKALAGGNDALGKRIHDQNPMEKGAQNNAERLHRL